MEKKLEVKNLKISFRTPGGKVQAVRDISFDLYKGETLAIVGESGSGKSVTNRAIIGILAGNSIVENGEIIYDGQDLLKVSEEEFHKLRGDKIAMIFQDPMSSLNPIMRVGKQLTEAMLLKGKASQKNARNDFNNKLALLNDYMDLAEPEKKDEHKKMCNTFDSFCISATKMEGEYNSISNTIKESVSDIEQLLFMNEKKQLNDAKTRVAGILSDLKNVYHDFLIKRDGNVPTLTAKLKEEYKSIKNGNLLSENAVAILSEIKNEYDSALALPKPNFFRLGYYSMVNPNCDFSNVDIEALNEEALHVLDSQFLIGFINIEKKAIKYSRNESLNNRKKALDLIADAKKYFSGDIDKNNCKSIVNGLKSAVAGSIDRLSIHKDGVAYTFNTSIDDAIDKYFAGLEKNPIEEARYNKQNAKREALIAKGKNPEWKVVPMSLVDLDAAKKNIIHVLDNLENDFRDDIEKEANYDYDNASVEIIDWFKEKASAVVYKVTRRLAKLRALKLLEEVGISEPAARYKQYPFEFSGGMRQRIVIAIALAADPDILICDEPTTALDVTIQAQILELINRIKAERNLSVIFITHDLGVVANMADRIAVMYAGKIVEYGTTDDVFYDPRHPYTWALLSSIPDLDTKDRLEAIPGTPPDMIYPPVGDAFADRNKYALQIDYEQQPPMFKISETHSAATWLLHPNAPKIDPPSIVIERIKRMSAKGED